MRKILFMLLVVGLLFTTAAVSGCTSSSIQSPEQASGAIQNVSNDVEDVASTLEGIDQALG